MVSVLQDGREVGVPPPFIFDTIAVMVECLIWART
jgi:hypothetical protein